MLLVVPRRKSARGVWGGVQGPAAPAVAIRAGGSLIIRRVPASAVWGGYASSAIAPLGQVASGWLVIRRQPVTAVWGGYAAVSNIAPAPAAVTAALGGFQDRRPGYLKKRVLFGM